MVFLDIIIFPLHQKTSTKSPLLLIMWAFVWVVMPTYQRAITKAFHEYIDVLMKIFLDDLWVLVTCPLI
jgi:hypothetical protein